jgi:uncharacterized protein
MSPNHQISKYSMPLLIDGYNLLNVTGIVGRGIGPGTLERSRLALLNFLAESIDPRELPHSTVVFDAKDAPPGLPRTVEHRGITVRFSSKYDSADELIGELIRADSAPRRLVVVSSDHEIQRAAKRRKAKAVDSEVWYADLIRARWERRESTPEVPERPAVPLLEEDVNYWLRQFGGESAFLELFAKEETGGDANKNSGDGGGCRKKSSQGESTQPDNLLRPPRPAKDDRDFDKPSESEFGPLDNPFPPGYGEDLLKDL